MPAEQESTAAYTDADLDAVQAKMRAFGAALTPGERAAFTALLERISPVAADETAEVAGYCGPTYMSADTGTSFSSPVTASIGQLINGFTVSLSDLFFGSPDQRPTPGAPQAGVVLARFRDVPAH